MDEKTTGVEDTIATSAPENDLLERAAATARVLQQLAPQYDAERVFPEQSFAYIREANLLATPLTTELGGEAVHGCPSSRLQLLRLLKHIGRGDLSVGRLYEGHVNALQLFQIFGTEAQIRQWAADARDRGMLFAVWNTEAGDGVRLEPLPGGGVRLHGSKTFASGAGNIDRPIVPGALPDGGWQMCVVPMEQVDVTIDRSWWNPPGMHASTSFKVDFTGVELDSGALLGMPGDYHRQPWFFGGAVRFAAVHLGGAEALLEETRAFLQSLGRTGDPHQLARAGEATILVESGNHWLEGASRVVSLDPGPHSEDDSDRIISYAHMVRLAIEEVCMQVIQLTERSVGARGLLQPVPIERIIRDLTLYLRQPAPDAALTSAGRHLLDSDTPVHRIWHDE